MVGVGKMCFYEVTYINSLFSQNNSKQDQLQKQKRKTLCRLSATDLLVLNVKIPRKLFHEANSEEGAN